MRATFWSLAALTGAVLAAPGSDAWGSPAEYGSASSVSHVSTSAEVKTSSTSSSSTCTEEEKSALTSSTPVPQGYLSSSVVIPSYSSIISSSVSVLTPYKVSSSSKVSVASASVPSKASSAVSSSLKSSISSVSSSKAKSTFTSTKKVSSTITVYTTVYTSVGTATTTKSNGGRTETSTYLTTDVKTSTVTSYVAVTPVSPSSIKESSKPADVTVVRTTKVYTTICPSGAASGSGSSSLATPATTVTKYTSIFTTICPETATSVSGSATLTKTYDVTSKITSVYETTVTLTTSTLTYGTNTIPVTIPIETSSIKYPPGYGSSSKSRPSKASSQSKSKASSQSKSKASSYSGSKASMVSSASRTSTKMTLSATSSSTAVPSSTVSPNRPMPYGDDCVRCAGQPGTDEFCGYTVYDNSYEVTPITCKTRKYEFTLSNQTISPDGVERYGLVINGQVPGPQVEANWGDWIEITLHNTLQNNGTSLHMHGFRQFYTNEMDGVASITQCPTAPGDSITYTFRADNYGTSWYHSHFSLQTYEGFFGPVVIHGPQAVEYDAEEMIVLSDWNHIPVDMMFDAAQFVGPPPANGPRVLDTGLINGLNVWGSDGSASQTGERFVLNVESGKKYLLRIVSSSIQATFKFYVDGHSFTVVSNDFVPIVPYTTNILNINIGQRYNVILEANQAPGNYWMRADNQEACGSITNGKNIKGVVRYQGAAAVNPTSTKYTYVEECVDEPLASLVPVVPISVGAASETFDESIFIKPYDKDPSVYRWTLSDAFFQADYDTPSLGGILTNGDVPYTGNLVIDAPKLGEWIYIIIDSLIPVPHPIHLHGHDFMVLAQGPGTYNSALTVLNTVNPPRRDVALMPGSGHLVMAFKTDNPGVWLLHCHIGWHSAMGFALQIVENLENIASTVVGADQISDTCKNWQTYAHADDIKVLDSGI